MQQDVVVPLFKPSPLHLQQMLNIWGVAVSLVTALLTGDFLPGLSFLMKNKLCLWVMDFCCYHVQYAVQFGLCSSIGQLFILYTVRHFPPLVLSTITTTRKFFSILISVLFMGNDINAYQVFFYLCDDSSGWEFSLCFSVFSLIKCKETKRNRMVIS